MQAFGTSVQAGGEPLLVPAGCMGAQRAAGVSVWHPNPT